MTDGNVVGYNAGIVVLESAAYTTNQTVDLLNQTQKGVQVVLDVTVKTSTPTNLVLTIYGKDPASGKYYTLLTGAAVTGVSTNRYTVHPNVTAATNVAINDFLPHEYRIAVVGTGVDSTHFFTFSVGANLLS